MTHIQSSPSDTQASDGQFSGPQVQYSKEQSISVSAKDWKQLRGSKQADAMQQELQDLVDKGKQFIRTHSKGSQKERALKGLNLFEKNRVRCFACNRDHSTFSLSRTNLATFDKLLNNPDLSLDDRVRAAENLFGSLGVCAEGEASNIQDYTSELASKLEGVEGKFKNIKKQLANQLLLKLVRHVVPEWANASIMEIHRVNALSNELSAELGIEVKEDSYSCEYFAKSNASYARQLIQTCLTPEVLVHTVAMELQSLAQSSLNISAGEKTEWNKEAMDVLSDGLKAQFQSKVSLHDLIELDEDTGQITIKPQEQIQQVALNLGIQAKCIDPKTKMDSWNADTSTSAEAFLKTIKPNSYSMPVTYRSQFISHFQLMNHFEKQEAEKKKKNQPEKS